MKEFKSYNQIPMGREGLVDLFNEFAKDGWTPIHIEQVTKGEQGDSPGYNFDPIEGVSQERSGTGAKQGSTTWQRSGYFIIFSREKLKLPNWNKQPLENKDVFPNVVSIELGQDIEVHKAKITQESTPEVLNHSPAVTQEGPTGLSGPIDTIVQSKIAEDSSPEFMLNDGPRQLFPITIVMPVFGRPEQTARAIQSIIDQKMPRFQAIIIGDACPDFEAKMIDGSYAKIREEQAALGREFIFINYATHKGGWGYSQRNGAKKLIKGDYVCFLDNDDFIIPDHLTNYYNSIAGQNYRFVIHDVQVTTGNGGHIRTCRAERGFVGHAEMVIESSYYQSMADQSDQYGHDWELFLNLQKHCVGRWAESHKMASYIIVQGK